MNIRPNMSEAYPIYLNPTSQEIQALADSKWDTLRVLLVEKDWRIPDGEYICIGSGYGNTHETLAWALREHFKVKKCPFSSPLIIFHVDSKAYVNCSDVSGPDKMIAGRALKRYCNQFEQDILESIIQASGLVLI